MRRTKRWNCVTTICGKAACTSLREVRRGIGSSIHLELPLSRRSLPSIEAPEIVFSDSKCGNLTLTACRLLGRRTGAAGADRRRQYPDPAQCPRHHADDRRADDHRRPGLCLVVSRLQHAGALPARLRLFRPHRAHRLGDPASRHLVSRRRDLDRRARSRSVQADRNAGKAGRGAGRLARLEMAVRLSRARGRERERSCGARQSAGAFLAHFRERDEHVLCAAARQHGRDHERYGHPAMAAGRPDRRALRTVEPIQRRRLRRHELHRARGSTGPASSNG